jgi:hypothetical protein
MTDEAPKRPEEQPGYAERDAAPTTPPTGGAAGEPPPVAQDAGDDAAPAGDEPADRPGAPD